MTSFKTHEGNSILSHGSFSITILEPCGAVSADLGFVLDASGSLKDRYNDEKYFLKTLASSFGISKNDVRASVVTFSSWPELSIKFSDHKTTDSFNSAVDAIPLMGYQTRIDKALQMVKSEMFTPENGARASIPKILILLTDGAQTKQTGYIDPAFPAEELRKAGVYLVVIGIGSKVDVAELKHMAGDTGTYYTAASFDELISDDFIRNISKTACPGKKAKKKFFFLTQMTLFQLMILFA